MNDRELQTDIRGRDILWRESSRANHLVQEACNLERMGYVSDSFEYLQHSERAVLHLLDLVRSRMKQHEGREVGT